MKVEILELQENAKEMVVSYGIKNREWYAGKWVGIGDVIALEDYFKGLDISIIE